MKLEAYLTPGTKISSRWVKYLNIRLGTIKFLGKNKQTDKQTKTLGNKFLDFIV